MTTYIESITEKLKGKKVEIYLGDTFQVIKQADYDHNIFSVVVGTILDGSGDCLVVETVYFDAVDKIYKTGNVIYLNGYNVKAITEINNRGTLLDIFKDTAHARKNL